MSKIKKFLSLTLFLAWGLVGAILLTHFSVAQNYGPTENSLLDRILSFIMPSNPVYLYAVTEPNTYNIVFSGNWNTSWNMGSMSMTYDKEEKLLANNFEKDWYAFKWWSRTKAWTVEYLDQSEVKNLTTEDLGEVTLYAQREVKVSYTVEYYQENVAWTWYDVVTWTQLGISGTVWEAEVRYFTWFTYNSWDNRNITTGNINGDLVLVVYYTRNTYRLTVKDRDNTLIDTWIKYWGNVELPANNPEWTWNTFEWWNNIPADGKMPANDLEITSTWSYGAHTITFDTNWGSEISPITRNYWENITIPGIPTREGYEFVWWSPELPDTMPYDDIVVTAVWKEIKKDSGWSGRWWRSWGWSDTSDWGNQHWAAEDKNIQWSGNTIEKPDVEVLAAYMWAYRKWIIWTGWQDSNPDGYITRWDMAEMVVKFTENVLWRKIPPVPAKCKRWDAKSEWKSSETKVYAEKACALWVMWIRMDDFMPNKLIDRAEFWTILSRLLWWSRYDVVDATITNPYYARHLEALNKAGVMRQIDDPKSKNELRKRAWIMLMRVKYIKEVAF